MFIKIMIAIVFVLAIAATFTNYMALKCARESKQIKRILKRYDQPWYTKE